MDGAVGGGKREREDWRNSCDGTVRMSGGCVKVVVTDKEMGEEDDDDGWHRGSKKEERLILHFQPTRP